jgi:hypothetical protein
VRIDVDSVKPDASAVRGALLMAPSGEIAFDMRGYARVRSGSSPPNRRVVGNAAASRAPRRAMSQPGRDSTSAFSAPVFRSR